MQHQPTLISIGDQTAFESLRRIGDDRHDFVLLTQSEGGDLRIEHCMAEAARIEIPDVTANTTEVRKRLEAYAPQTAATLERFPGLPPNFSTTVTVASELLANWERPTPKNFEQLLEEWHGQGFRNRYHSYVIVGTCCYGGETRINFDHFVDRRCDGARLQFTVRNKDGHHDFYFSEEGTPLMAQAGRGEHPEMFGGMISSSAKIPSLYNPWRVYDTFQIAPSEELVFQRMPENIAAKILHPEEAGVFVWKIEDQQPVIDDVRFIKWSEVGDSRKWTQKPDGIFVTPSLPGIPWDHKYAEADVECYPFPNHNCGQRYNCYLKRGEKE